MSVMIPIWEEEQAPRLGASGRDDRRFGLGMGIGRRHTMREELDFADVLHEEEEEHQQFSSPLSSPSSSDDEEEHEHDEEEQHLPGSSGSSVAAEPLESLGSLEDSLPTKRGLSSFFSGKSKSFATLADVVTRPSEISASDLAKPENPFNKRRRVRIIARMRRRAASSSNLPSFLMMRRGMSCGALADSVPGDEEDEVEEGSRLFSPPQELLALHEEEEDEDEDDDGGRDNRCKLHALHDEDEDEGGRDNHRSGGGRSPIGPLGFHRADSGRQLQIGGRGFPSPRSYSLTDLHQHAATAAAEFA